MEKVRLGRLRALRLTPLAGAAKLSQRQGWSSHWLAVERA